MNFYSLLGVSQDADDEAIRSAYRILARRYHPDRGAGSNIEKFRQVHEAYETLVDPATRRAYDLSLRHPEPAPFVPVEPIGSPFGLVRQENPEVFGRLRDLHRQPDPWDEWSRLFDDLFFGRKWPW